MMYLEGGWCVENTWWGFNIYLTHTERQHVSTGQIIAGLATLGIASLLVGAVAGVIANYDNGYGVRLRMTGPLKANAVLTGIYGLTYSQQKNIASKNTVIW